MAIWSKANIQIGDAVDLGIWSGVEPNIGILGACMPLMGPIFRKVKALSTKKSSHGGSSAKTWPHSRLNEHEAKMSTLQHCSKGPPESHPPAYPISDDIPLSGHREWTAGRSGSDVKQQGSTNLEIPTLSGNTDFVEGWLHLWAARSEMIRFWQKKMTLLQLSHRRNGSRLWKRVYVWS